MSDDTCHEKTKTNSELILRVVQDFIVYVAKLHYNTFPGAAHLKRRPETIKNASVSHVFALDDMVVCVHGHGGLF